MLSLLIHEHGMFYLLQEMCHSSSNIDTGGSFACVGAESVWEFSVLATQFCCEYKTSPQFKACILRSLLTSPVHSLPVY